MTAPDDLHAWTVSQGLTGRDLGVLLEGAATRLIAAGIPLARAYLALPTLSPNTRVTSFLWDVQDGLSEDRLAHGVDQRVFEASPFFAMLRDDEMSRRWSLVAGTGLEDYPLLRDLRVEGHTDYIALLIPFGAADVSALQGAALSFSTAASEGFCDADATAIGHTAPLIAMAAFRIALFDVVVGVLDAYVGLESGRRVLNGEMLSGHGESLDAALLFADLRGFTKAADMGGAGIVPRLGRHLAAMAEPVEQEGGEILKFLGDGLIAAFPIDASHGPQEACAAALRAAREAVRRNGLIDSESGLGLGLDVALHRGTVFYGNIGAGRRLDFTVIGPAVNEVSRIEAFCGTLGEPILMSADFAPLCGCASRSLGRHVLRGVAAERELFGLAENAGPMS